MDLRRHVAACAAIVVVSLCGAGTEARAQDEPRANATVKAVRKVKPSVIAIKVPGANPSSKGTVGTGVIIDERGIIVTNRHVVAGADHIIVRLVDETEVPAKILVSDASTDLAILKIDPPKKLQALRLADTSDVEVGEDVIAVGHPYGYSYTVTKGIISATGRKIELPNGVVLKHLIQTSAQINPGNSGGPLLNINGEFIGINTALRDGAQGIAFAISIDTVKQLCNEKLSAWKIAGVQHGLKVQDKLIAETGDRQQVVVADGAAGGLLKPGDVIKTVGNLQVKNSFDLERSLWDTKSGQQIAVQVMRQGQPVTVTLTLTPASGVVVSSSFKGQ